MSFKVLYEFCTLLGPAEEPTSCCEAPAVSPVLSCVVMLNYFEFLE